MRMRIRPDPAMRGRISRAGLAQVGTFGLWIQESASGRLGAMCPAQEVSGGGQAPSLSRRQVVPQGRQGTSERQGPAAGNGNGNGVRRGAGQPILVGTKLHPPSVRELTIPRERLLERLRSGSDRRLTLVACPAGFGKTTLLAAWREAEAARKPVAWLTLDEGDNDPVVLWSYVIEALRRASPAVARSAAADTVVAPVVDVVLPRLVNELDGQGEITLILDDFHRLSSVPARASVRWFIDHAPPGFQLVLASRTEPALPVAALRAHDELLELRAGELRFTCRGGGRLPERPPRARPHARRCRRPGREDGGMAGRALSRRALAASTLPTATRSCVSSAARTATWWISW